ncbi:DUF4402 domain-containing protein [Maribrevibacterium harenarium]|uniref:DUF4402 domain-containing protein n=1 Tax=Maribrevibacterium harenarium TaxID=2589817 RepID=A0A501X217_9GAMM|nr:DUF4402 domain-containing protein [Maribrevibacterium harenarium]TPE54518.1 DUF4402 domain-containing protein [Maribrevibacterium harenarium]
MRSTTLGVLSLILICTATFLSDVVKADITEVTPLSFGTIAVTRNQSVEYVAIDYNGNVSRSSGIHVISAPQVGEYTLSNYPANQLVFLSATSVQATSNSVMISPEQFRLTATSIPNSLTTDGSGNGSFYVGGTLSTSGSGSTVFVDTTYRINYLISVNY